MRKPAYYWNYERCRIEALEFNSRVELKKKSKGCYAAALRNNWMDKICLHMDICNHSFHDKRYVYAIEFDDNHIYVGLTSNLKRRIKEHLGLIKHEGKSSVLEYIILTNKTPKIINLTEEPISEKNAIISEKFYIDEYRKNGWILLNKKAGGSLGSRIKKWNKESARIEATKYKLRKSFQRNSGGAYKFSRKNNYLDEFFPNTKKQKPTNYWNYERSKEAASNYPTRMDFKNNISSAYNASKKNKWLDDFFPNKSKYWEHRVSDIKK